MMNRFVEMLFQATAIVTGKISQHDVQADASDAAAPLLAEKCLRQRLDAMLQQNDTDAKETTDQAVHRRIAETAKKFVDLNGPSSDIGSTWIQKSEDIASRLYSADLKEEALQVLEYSVEIARVKWLTTPSQGVEGKLLQEQMSRILAKSLDTHSAYLKMEGRLEEAVKQSQQAVEIYMKFCEAPNRRLKYEDSWPYAAAIYNLAKIHYESNNHAEAEERVSKAIRLHEGLKDKTGDKKYKIEILRHLAQAYALQGLARGSLKKHKDACKSLRASVEESEQLVRLDSAPDSQIRLIKSRFHLSRALVEFGNFREAVEECDLAMEKYLDLGSDFKKQLTTYLHDALLSVLEHTSKANHRKLKKLKDATTCYRHLINALDFQPEYRFHLSNVRAAFVTHLAKHGQHAEARQHADWNVESLQELAEADATSYTIPLAKALINRCVCEDHTNDISRAYEMSKLAVQTLSRMYETNKNAQPDELLEQYVAALRSEYNAVLRTQGTQGALDVVKREVNVTEEAAKGQTAISGSKLFYANALYRQATLLFDLMENVNVKGSQTVNTRKGFADSNEKLDVDERELQEPEEQFREYGEEALTSAKEAIEMYKESDNKQHSEDIEKCDKLIKKVKKRLNRSAQRTGLRGMGEWFHRMFSACLIMFRRIPSWMVNMLSQRKWSETAISTSVLSFRTNLLLHI
jgi:tetratricopeptide (TPR) repeat protein